MLCIIRSTKYSTKLKINDRCVSYPIQSRVFFSIPAHTSIPRIGRRCRVTNSSFIDELATAVDVFSWYSARGRRIYTVCGYYYFACTQGYPAEILLGTVTAPTVYSIVINFVRRIRTRKITIESETLRIQQKKTVRTVYPWVHFVTYYMLLYHNFSYQDTHTFNISFLQYSPQ